MAELDLRGAHSPTAPSGRRLAWSERVDDILAGDIVVALAYRTPLGGVVLTPVDPMGMRDRDRGTVAFSTSLAFWKKLSRIERSPQVALCYHTRAHGFSREPGWLVVQGTASFPSRPSEEWHALFRREAPRFLGQLKSGLLWDRLTREYYWVRVPVTIEVHRIIEKGAPGSAGEPTVLGAPLPPGPPPPQDPPAGGVDPRTSVTRVARRASRLDHTLLGYVGSDGYPDVVAVKVEGSSRRGLVLEPTNDSLPSGGRRAGLLAHVFGPLMVRQESRLITGWLTVTRSGALYAPHTTAGNPRTPGGTRMLTLIASLASKASIRGARKRGLVEGDRWVGHGGHDPHQRQGERVASRADDLAPRARGR